MQVPKYSPSSKKLQKYKSFKINNFIWDLLVFSKWQRKLGQQHLALV